MANGGISTGNSLIQCTPLHGMGQRLGILFADRQLCRMQILAHDTHLDKGSKITAKTHQIRSPHPPPPFFLVVCLQKCTYLREFEEKKRAFLHSYPERNFYYVVYYVTS